MKIHDLAIDLLRIDGGTQSRLKINEEVVEDYAEIISASKPEWPFPSLDVFHDGTDYYVADGFHRLLAGHQAKRGSIPCRVHSGTSFDAHVFGMTANDRHGLRMARADKRACVEWLLDCGRKMTQKEIAEKAGVSRATVAVIVADRKPPATTTQGGGQNVQNRHFTPHSDGEMEPDSDPFGGSTDPFDDGGDPFGEDASTEAPGTTPQETGSQPPRNGTDKPAALDYGKCPNCAGSKWVEDDEGVSCAKCRHPHGEPVGGPDEDRVNTQRQKTVKTAEALLRAFDDLNGMIPKKEHAAAVDKCKHLIGVARGWK